MDGWTVGRLDGSFKRSKNIGNFLVRSYYNLIINPVLSSFATKCKTCPFIHKVNKISVPK